MYNKNLNSVTFEEDTLIPDIPIIMRKGQTLRLPSDSQVIRAVKEVMEMYDGDEEEEEYFYDL